MVLLFPMTDRFGGAACSAGGGGIGKKGSWFK